VSVLSSACVTGAAVVVVVAGTLVVVVTALDAGAGTGTGAGSIAPAPPQAVMTKQKAMAGMMRRISRNAIGTEHRDYREVLLRRVE
jgi:hypothetical protein